MCQLFYSRMCLLSVLNLFLVCVEFVKFSLVCDSGQGDFITEICESCRGLKGGSIEIEIERRVMAVQREYTSRSRPLWICVSVYAIQNWKLIDCYP
jgi:hypothetical protein